MSRAAERADRAPVADLHVDLLSKLIEHSPAANADCHVTIDRCQAGNVRLLFAACFTRDGDGEAREKIGAMLERAECLACSPASSFVRVTSADDVARMSAGKTGLCLTIENAHVLAEDLSLLARWHESGVRALSLTWNGANALGSGVLAAQDCGLTERGREVVREAARLQMAVDLSHLAPRGVFEVLDGDVCVLASHSNTRAIWDHPRNLSDVQLRAIAARGGIIGVNLYPSFLAAEGAANLETVALHAAHIAEIAGPECVALGSDLDGFEPLPPWFSGYQDLPLLKHSLSAACFSAKGVEALLWENVLAWWTRP